MLIGPQTVQSRGVTHSSQSRFHVRWIAPAAIAPLRMPIQYRSRRVSFCLMAFRFGARDFDRLAMRWGVFYLLQSRAVSLPVCHVEWQWP